MLFKKGSSSGQNSPVTFIDTPALRAMNERYSSLYQARLVLEEKGLVHHILA
jgi:hypothetical protein